ncbi:MAG: MgtC/SapB family protein [Chloroflexota bacterium]
MSQADLFLRFSLAIGIGFMIGLQREFASRGSSRKLVAGERTLALMGLAGALAAMVADLLNAALAFIAIIILVGLFVLVAYFIEAWRGHPGLTSEIASLIVVLLGALCYWGHMGLAVALGITTAVLLTIKFETERLVQALTNEDIFAALQLAVISAIVLPVLPDQSIGPPPFDALNPFNIWLMVVFISAINFLGYVLMKAVGAEKGIELTGFLGGLVSSTAVTLGFSERSRREEHLSKTFALAITLAWTVMFARVLAEVAVMNKALLAKVAPPLLAAALAGLLYCAFLHFTQHATAAGELKVSKPDLASAVKFGLFYAAILLVARTALLYFGNTGVLVSSVLSGLADVDAITLSMAELSFAGALDIEIAALAVILATMSNTVIKGSIVLLGSAPGLRKTILPGLLLILVAGVGLGIALLI